MNTSNTTAETYTTASGPQSRRCSTETIYSIQDRETDLLRDTSDTEWCDSSDERRVEYEPVSDSEEDGPIDGDSSGNSDNEIITTKVIEVTSISIKEYDGDQECGDGDQECGDGATSGCDSEMDFNDYWNCAQCLAQNNNPLYRYCEKCFKVRKNFFPSRPKRKHKLGTRLKGEILTHALSKDSGVESAVNSQELSQDLDEVDGPSQRSVDSNASRLSDNVILGRNPKRRAESVDRKNKRIKIDYSGSETDSESDRPTETAPLVKMVSDPALTVDEPDSIKLTKKAIANTLKEKHDDNMCITCYSEPKSGVFVHGRIAHICCCYKCARQVWAKAKRCPICNRKVSNVLRAVVM